MDEPGGPIKRKSRLAVFEHVTEKQKSPTKIKFRSNPEDSSPSESELVIDDKEEPVKKKRSALIRFTEEPLNMSCKWKVCDERFDSWSKFNTHLIDHATADSEALKCHWKDCNAQSQNVTLLTQHVSFHGYLTKLKNIGQNVLCRNNLPLCRLKEYYTVPAYPGGYVCEWEYCSFQFYTIYDFYTHIDVHIKNNPKKCKESSGETIPCGWKHCNTKYLTQYKLAEHVRTHTKEKTLACPTCCSLFSSKTKFCDHRKRQLSTNLASYQCSQCLKLFASERLLRDHMRSHINHYKCTMCDMTCPKPSLLAKHIRFKHVKDKPYECNECGKKFVTKANLTAHLQTHSPEEIMQCEQCDFKCRTKIGLDNHQIKFHAKSCPVYECHCCKKRFKRGGYLTEHLMKCHNYHWPSGHSRFRYRKDQDGICRLQTVRYESLEVTQEMIRSESMQTNNVSKVENYSLKYDNDGSSKYVLTVSENGEHSFKPTEPKESKILITINDVDEQGNIVNSEVVESGSTELIGTVYGSDIAIVEHALADVSEYNEEARSTDPEREVNLTSKGNVEVDQTKDNTEDLCYFPKRCKEEAKLIEPKREANLTTKGNVEVGQTEDLYYIRCKEEVRLIEPKRETNLPSNGNMEVDQTEENTEDLCYFPKRCKEEVKSVGPTYEENLNSKGNVEVSQTEGRTEGIRYFSKEVILNYNQFKIETTKSELI